MKEISIKIPAGLSEQRPTKRNDGLASDEELELTLFNRDKEDLSLAEDDFQELEAAGERHGQRRGRSTASSRCNYYHLCAAGGWFSSDCRQPTIASLIFCKASFALLPWEWQPGRAGQLTT